MKKFIYLIKSEETGYYKIGFSKNPNKRMKQLQTGNSEKLILLEKYESEFYKEIEKSLHNQYHYLKNEGEWFDLDLEKEYKFIEDVQLLEKNFKIIKENKI